MTTVLVAYGSKSGGTQGIAETVGTTLRDAGCRVDVRPAADVRDVSGYDAVVLGGALYAGRWHRAARAFARRFGADLAGRPVWLFSSGPLDRSAEDRDIPPVPAAAEAMERLRARAHATFGGALSSDAKGFLTRSMARNLADKGLGGDFRDAAHIRGWAGDIAAALRSPEGTSVPRSRPR